MCLAWLWETMSVREGQESGLSGGGVSIWVSLCAGCAALMSEVILWV